MKKLSLLILLIIMVSCSTPEIKEEKSIYVPETKQIETDIMSLVNTWRIDEGLDSLLTNKYIKSEAYIHTIYMISKGVPSHDGFMKRKENLFKRGAVRVGENVAFGYSKAETVVASWIRSDGHGNIMEGDYTHFEIVVEEDLEGNKYFTNIYIKQ